MRNAAKLRAREAMLHGPIFKTMMRLALPTIGVLVARTLVNVAETFYVSRLGTDALVGVALVFPVWMLMTMMAAGGIGEGWPRPWRGPQAPAGMRTRTPLSFTRS
jgi:Na+-driven multidrug efflux pump